MTAAKRKPGETIVQRRNHLRNGGPAEIVLRERDDRFTAPEFIRAVEESFGPIDFDPCWHLASAVRPTRWFDARRGDDGLHDPWQGGFAFVNPPWSNQKKWLARTHDQWRRGTIAKAVCLVPTKTDSDLFQDVVSEDAEIYLVRGRPRFSKKGGGRPEGTMVSAMVVMFGTTAEERRRFAERVRGRWCVVTRYCPGRSEGALLGANTGRG